MQKSNIKNIIFTTLLVIIFYIGLYSNPTEANPYRSNITEEITINYGKKTIIEIPANRVSMINVKEETLNDGSIVRIVKDDSKIDILFTFNKKLIYIKPKVKVGEYIDISLLSLSGDIINLKLKVVHKTDKNNITLIRPDKKSREGILRKKVEYILQSMQNNKEDNIHIENVNHELKITGLPDHITLFHTNSYKYENLNGMVIQVHNKDKNTVEINPSIIGLNLDNVIKFVSRFNGKHIYSSKFVNSIYVIYKKN